MKLVAKHLPIIDDRLHITIGDSSSATGIQDIMLNGTNVNAKIYTLDGRYVGTDAQTLSKGVYVIGNKKVVVD
jgi:hypothetical protein